MPKKKYEVLLTPEDESVLKSMTHTGNKYSAREILHAQVLLHSNDSRPGEKKNNRELAEWLDISPTTVNQIRRTYAESGLEAALRRKTRITPPVASKITGDFEAKVIAAALGPPPEGRSRWTLRLLAEHCMEKKYIVSVSYVAIGELLNTNELKPHLSKYWRIPKQNDPAFVANMEDVLGIYQRPHCKNTPVVCMDEKPLQLLDEIRERISAKPARIDPDTQIQRCGYCEKIDSEYVRCGTASIFMFTEPLGGWRHVYALERRTKGDYAKMMQKIADEFYPECDRIIMVSDNLNTHDKASFYEAFPPQTAFRLAQKFEMHYTPKHGSWLNIAETELSALTMQCLGNRRIHSLEELNGTISDWEKDRNKKQVGVKWHFTAEDARIKLKRLYPKPLFEE